MSDDVAFEYEKRELGTNVERIRHVAWRRSSSGRIQHEPPHQQAESAFSPGFSSCLSRVSASFHFCCSVTSHPQLDRALSWLERQISRSGC